MMTRYEICLEGVHALDLPLGVLRDLADFLVEGSSRAARLAAEGRSIARGSAPVWLAETSDIRLVGFHEGSLALDVTARPLVEVGPGIFPSDARETAFDLLIRAVDDALQGRRDSERLDFGMLQTLVKTRMLFGRGATRLCITRIDGISMMEEGASVAFSESAVEEFQALARETPAPKTDRVVGVLDSLTMSTRTGLLKLEDGASLKGNIGASVNLGHLKNLLGSEVVAEGTVSFRPSGRPQRIEIDYVDRATDKDILWRRMPRGELANAQLPLPAEGLGSYFGQWPGEEDDEQIFAALRELS